MLSFQEIISRLTSFWTEQGCTFHQGHDVEVGAGTFNPATFLRSLGPEPYNTVYVEPSRRPQDGRYGENPNRTQLFHQLQVIMKPSPVNIQELYLKSLEAIGFDLSEHDIRFVHDDWESPTLGAWGLGWEVWIDGMEATQFTYFQSVAGESLSPISVELTYGLERLCMFLQKKESFFEMDYNDGLTYGEVYRRNEEEWSRYNFDFASTSMWLKHFEDYEREAKYLIEANLPLPAYDFAMKASHAFNILEARGVLSTTERTNYIHRIRELSRLSAVEYLTSREAQGFPLLKDEAEIRSIRVPDEMPAAFDANAKKDFLFEIGSEQLPATFIPVGMRALKSGVESLLKNEGLSHGEIEVFGTPRRLSVLVRDLAFGGQDETVERRGPLLEVAFNEHGLTKQGAGFARSIGREEPFSLEDVRVGSVPGIEVRTIKDSEYLFVNSVKRGKSTFEVLTTNLPKIILGIAFPKTMRWNNFDVAYARPIQWIVAMHGDEVYPFQVANASSGNTTYGHAQLAPGPIELTNPGEYVDKLRSAKVIACSAERAQSIEKQLEKLEAKYDVQAAAKRRVLNEVVGLTEWPELAVHTFDEKFLGAPKEVLISEMVEHQRYFPLESSDGTLTNMFVITADNQVNPIIMENNGRVLSARLSDGVFLFNQDVEMGLAKMNELLETVTYHKELGTVQDKVSRVVKNARLLAETLEVDPKGAVRAAELCKADLCSNLVREFPELQGTLGKYYALKQNEPQEVAAAIEEHYLPNSEGGPLPQSETGKIVSLADKIDNLLSCMSIGIKATSSSDPYALRRQAFGVIKILIDNRWAIDLEELFTKISGNRNLTRDVLTFFRNRMKSVLLDYNFNKDEIEAALPKIVSDPFDAYCKVKALHEFRTSKSFTALYEVYKRARGQIEDEDKQSINQGLLGEPSEHMLYSSLTEMRLGFDKALEMRDYTSAFSTLSTLQKPLADLFDQVKILSDNTSIRNNRIALLQQVFSLFNRLLDFSKIQ